ncbi:hypothetical protein ACJMK2_032579 [Sinanodonta woodiana]|uniref:Uncharacterized protein n=1 Tax=Sinanodonta woodiana TaxID=1069815 RepID=A0ABD3X403_SINWO
MSSPTKGQSLRLAVSRTMEKNRVFRLAQCLIRSIEEETLAGVDLLHTLEVVRRTSNPDLDYFRDLNESTDKRSAADLDMKKSTKDIPTNDSCQAVSSSKNHCILIDHLPQINETMDEDLIEGANSRTNEIELFKNKSHKISVMPLRRWKSLPSFTEVSNQTSFEENNRCMSDLRSYELNRLHRVSNNTNETIGREKPDMIHEIAPNLECKEHISSEDPCSEDTTSISSDELEVKSIDNDTQSEDGSFLREFYPTQECSSMVRGKTRLNKDEFVANYVIKFPSKDHKHSLDVDLVKLFDEQVNNDEIGSRLTHSYVDASSSDTVHSSKQNKETAVGCKTVEKRSAKHLRNKSEVTHKKKPSIKGTLQRKSKHLIDYSTFIRSYQLYKQRRDERFNTYSKPEMIHWGDAFVQNLFLSSPTSCQKSATMDHQENKKDWNGIMYENLTARAKTDWHLLKRGHKRAVSSSHGENKFRCNNILKLHPTDCTKRHLPDIYPRSGISRGISAEPVSLKPHKSRDATYVDYKKLDTKSFSSKKPDKITEIRHAKEK